MKNLQAVFETISKNELVTSVRAGSPVVQATALAKMKRELTDALSLDLQAMFAETDLAFNIGMTGDGLVAGFEHDTLEKVKDAIGELVLQFDIKIKNLDYNMIEEIEMYNEEQELKAQEKAQAEIAKQNKIKHDAELRAQKARQKELNSLKTE